MNLPHNLPDYKNAIKEEIGTIYITGGGFIDRAFKGWGTDSKYGWQEMVWYSTPTRALNFAFSDMDNIDVGLVARCELNIKYMNIHDYMDLRKILGRERHFTVKFFDTDEGKWVKRDMYCSENAIGKLFNMKKSLIGVLDYTIKLVGTNLDLKTIYEDNIDAEGNISFTISYDSSGLSKSIPAQSVEWGEEIKTASDSDISITGGNFVCWERINDSGDVIGEYGANQSVTVWSDIKLRARINKL